MGVNKNIPGVVTTLALGVSLLLSVILWLWVCSLGGKAVTAAVLALKPEVHEDGEHEGHGDGGDKSGVSWLEAIERVSKM